MIEYRLQSSFTFLVLRHCRLLFYSNETTVFLR
nr:MAG TPA: hypothetical protein [Caudoviricetes sp.]